MIVKFETIKWHNILIPTEFNAYRCDGNCVFPLGTASNPTNHAQIQSLLALQGNFPNPCCVPTELGAISIMFFDGEENVSVKTFSEMTVKQCSCKWYIWNVKQLGSNVNEDSCWIFIFPFFLSFIRFFIVLRMRLCKTKSCIFKAGYIYIYILNS